MPEYKSTPPAFPQTGDTLIGEGKGMTLRDYFAAAALQTTFADRYFSHSRDAMDNAEGIAEVAYVIADAMLKERAK